MVKKVEWSGNVIYEEVGNLITDPANFKIILHEFFPMKKESATGVEQEPDGPFAGHYIKIKRDPKRKHYKYGTIHSHHGMGIFFSPTDFYDLQENAKSHNYYVSVVVDNFGQVLTYIGSISETTNIKERVRDGKGVWHEVETEMSKPQTLNYYVCDTQIPTTEVDDWFVERMNHVIKRAEYVPPPPRQKKTYTNPLGLPQQEFQFDNKDDDFFAGVETLGYTEEACITFTTMLLMGTTEWEGEMDSTLEEIFDEIKKQKRGLQDMRFDMANDFESLWKDYFGSLDEGAIIADTLIIGGKELAKYAHHTDYGYIVKSALESIKRLRRKYSEV